MSAALFDRPSATRQALHYSSAVHSRSPEDPASRDDRCDKSPICRLGSKFRWRKIYRADCQRLIGREAEDDNDHKRRFHRGLSGIRDAAQSQILRRGGETVQDCGVGIARTAYRLTEYSRPTHHRCGGRTVICQRGRPNDEADRIL
jgi:hypothetical protein